MTENDRDQNDRIRLLKVIQKRMIFVRKIMIVNEIVSVVLSPSIVLYTPKTVYVPLLSTQIFLLFLRESWQNISRNSSFSPFHSAFYPSYFCLLRRWKVPSEPLFLAFKSIFLLPFHRKTDPAFLAIFAWIMWFSIDDGIWLFRG